MHAGILDVLPPDTVEHALEGRFCDAHDGHGQAQLVLCTASSVRVYAVREPPGAAASQSAERHSVESPSGLDAPPASDSHAHAANGGRAPAPVRRPAAAAKGALTLLSETFLPVRILDAAVVRGEGARDLLLLALGDARFSIAEYDARLGSWHTRSLHAFPTQQTLSAQLETDAEVSRCGVRRHVSVAPGGGVAALHVNAGHVALLAEGRDDDDFDDDMRADTRATVWRGRVHAWREIDGRLLNVVDFCFLAGFHEPTLAILYEPRPTAPYRLPLLKDTLCLAVVTLGAAFAPLAHYEGLPSDARALHALPLGCGGGVLLHGAHVLVHVDPARAAPAAVALNAYASATTKMPGVVRAGAAVLNVGLEAAVFFVEPLGGALLAVADGGEWLRIVLTADRAAGRRVGVSPLDARERASLVPPEAAEHALPLRAALSFGCDMLLLVPVSGDALVLCASSAEGASDAREGSVGHETQTLGQAPEAKGDGPSPADAGPAKSPGAQPLQSAHGAAEPVADDPYGETGAGAAKSSAPMADDDPYGGASRQPADGDPHGSATAVGSVSSAAMDDDDPYAILQDAQQTYGGAPATPAARAMAGDMGDDDDPYALLEARPAGAARVRTAARRALRVADRIPMLGPVADVCVGGDPADGSAELAVVSGSGTHSSFAVVRSRVPCDVAALPVLHASADSACAAMWRGDLVVASNGRAGTRGLVLRDDSWADLPALSSAEETVALLLDGSGVLVQVTALGVAVHGADQRTARLPPGATATSARLGGAVVVVQVAGGRLIPFGIAGGVPVALEWAAHGPEADAQPFSWDVQEIERGACAAMPDADALMVALHDGRLEVSALGVAGASVRRAVLVATPAPGVLPMCLLTVAGEEAPPEVSGLRSEVAGAALSGGSHLVLATRTRGVVVYRLALGAAAAYATRACGSVRRACAQRPRIVASSAAMGVVVEDGADVCLLSADAHGSPRYVALGVGAAAEECAHVAGSASLLVLRHRQTSVRSPAPQWVPWGGDWAVQRTAGLFSEAGIAPAALRQVVHHAGCYVAVGAREVPYPQILPVDEHTSLSDNVSFVPPAGARPPRRAQHTLLLVALRDGRLRLLDEARAQAAAAVPLGENTANPLAAAVQAVGTESTSGLLLGDAEYALCLSSAVLETKQTAEGRKAFVALGTSVFRGEDRPARGRVFVLDAVAVVPEAGRPHADRRLKVLCVTDQRGPATALAGLPSAAALVIGVAGRSIVASLAEDAALEGVAFADTGVYATDAAGAKAFFAVADAERGLTLCAFQPLPPRVAVLGRDLDGSHCRSLAAAAILVSAEGEAAVLSADALAQVHVHVYAPGARTSLAGERLLPRGSFRMCSSVRRVRRFVTADHSGAGRGAGTGAASRAQHGALVATTEGGAALFAPVGEALGRRVAAVCARLAASAAPPFGLDVRTARLAAGGPASSVRSLPGVAIGRFAADVGLSAGARLFDLPAGALAALGAAVGADDPLGDMRAVYIPLYGALC